MLAETHNNAKHFDVTHSRKPPKPRIVQSYCFNCRAARNTHLKHKTSSSPCTNICMPTGNPGTAKTNPSASLTPCLSLCCLANYICEQLFCTPDSDKHANGANTHRLYTLAHTHTYCATHHSSSPVHR